MKHGVVPALISAFIVPELGPYWTKQWMLTGEKVDVMTAFQRDILTSVAKDIKDLDSTISMYASMIQENAPNAMKMVKKLIHRYNKDHEENLQHVQKVFEETVHSEEAKYGMECFKQKKKPNWNQFHSKL